MIQLLRHLPSSSLTQQLATIAPLFRSILRLSGLDLCTRLKTFQISSLEFSYKDKETELVQNNLGLRELLLMLSYFGLDDGHLISIFDVSPKLRHVSPFFVANKNEPKKRLVTVTTQLFD